MFSIVIPVYNAKTSLERCVDSWLCPTRKDLEIILVDDGSSDGSKELCDELAKNHSGTCLRVIHQANSGVSAARNAGIRAAEGEFLLFTDSDDYVEPDYLEKMAALQENSDADLVLCGYHHLYDGADIVKVFPANYLGEAYIRAIKAPLDYIPIAAVGGIRPEDIPAFQSAGVSCFGVGKQLVDAGLFSSYCDEEVVQIIEDRAKRYLQAIR